LSKCDCVGVWIPNKPQVEYLIGAFDFESFPDRCNGNIVILPDGKWWLVDFCDYQYGELTETCKPHKKYIALLRKYGLYDVVLKGYTKGMDTLQEKEEEEEQEKEKEKEEDNTYGKLENVKLSEDEYSKLIAEYGIDTANDYIDRLSIWMPNAPRKVKSCYATLLNWLRRDKVPIKPRALTCPDCGATLSDGICPNPDCPSYRR